MKSEVWRSLSQDIRDKISARPLLSFSGKDELDEKQSQIPIFFTYRSPSPRPQLPKEFKGQEVWKDRLSPVVNQGDCGSCWAVASVMTLNDRWNLMTTTEPIRLSYEYLLACEKSGSVLSEPNKIAILFSGKPVYTTYSFQQKNFICYGNFLSNALQYIHLFGVPNQECSGPHSLPMLQPYVSSNKSFSTCENTYFVTNDLCQFTTYHKGSLYGRPIRFYSALNVYNYPVKNRVSMIQEDLFLHGPVCTTFDCYSDFWTFDPLKEIYKKKKDSVRISGHSVEIVGWGEQDGVEFWWIKNSWGTEWGFHGFFRFLRGKNECSIESNACSVTPLFLKGQRSIPEIFELCKTQLDKFDIDTTKQKKFIEFETIIKTQYGYHPKWPFFQYTSYKICNFLGCDNDNIFSITFNGYTRLFEYSFPGIVLNQSILSNYFVQEGSGSGRRRSSSSSSSSIEHFSVPSTTTTDPCIWIVTIFLCLCFLGWVILFVVFYSSCRKKWNQKT